MAAGWLILRDMGKALRLLPLGAMLVLAGCIPGRRPEPAAPSVTSLPTPKRAPKGERVGVPTAAKVTPAWMARRVVPDAVEIPASTYIVRPGDSLGTIAERTGAGAEAIAR